MQNPFDFLDVSEEEAKESLVKIDKYGNRDGRVCICGHSINFHTFTESRGVHICNALKSSCPCKNPRPVIETSNTRVFLRKTYGGGTLHALTQGIALAIEKGASIDWIVEQKCDRCGTQSPVAPVPVSTQGVIRNEATGYDALLCRICRGGN